MVEGRAEGLRERKKRAARQGIATAARRLFAERGYDAVTVSEVAAAADVSEKTVFNHFPTKEELAFAGRADRLRALVGELSDRPAGTPVLDVFRAATRAAVDEVLDGSADDLAHVVGGSRALRSRLATGWEDEADALTAAIATTSGATDDDVVAGLMAHTLGWTHRHLLRLALDGLAAGEDRERLAARLHATADRAYDRLAAGLGDYGAA